MNKITQERIDAIIVSKTFIVLPDGVTTICQLILKNGFSVLGSSACVDPANFDLQMGRDIAFKNAQDKVWQLEGYLLKEDMFRASVKIPVTVTASIPVTITASAPVPTQISKTVVVPKKTAKAANPADNAAPWGYKKDGTPRGKPGRKA